MPRSRRRYSDSDSQIHSTDDNIDAVDITKCHYIPTDDTNSIDSIEQFQTIPVNQSPEGTLSFHSGLKDPYYPYGYMQRCYSNSASLWGDESGASHNPLAFPYTYVKKKSKGAHCKACVWLSILLVVLGVIGIIVVAVYLAMASKDKEIIGNDVEFLGSFKVNNRDAFDPRLMDSNTIQFAEKQAYYRRMIESLYRQSVLTDALQHCQILKFKPNLEVFFRLNFDRKKVPSYIDDLEKSVRDTMIQEVMSLSPQAFRLIDVDIDSVDVQRSDAVVQAGASLSAPRVKLDKSNAVDVPIVKTDSKDNNKANNNPYSKNQTNDLFSNKENNTYTSHPTNVEQGMGANTPEEVRSVLQTSPELENGVLISAVPNIVSEGDVNIIHIDELSLEPTLPPINVDYGPWLPINVFPTDEVEDNPSGSESLQNMNPHSTPSRFTPLTPELISGVSELFETSGAGLPTRSTVTPPKLETSPVKPFLLPSTVIYDRILYPNGPGFNLEKSDLSSNNQYSILKAPVYVPEQLVPPKSAVNVPPVGNDSLHSLPKLSHTEFNVSATNKSTTNKPTSKPESLLSSLFNSGIAFIGKVISESESRVVNKSTQISGDREKLRLNEGNLHNITAIRNNSDTHLSNNSSVYVVTSNPTTTNITGTIGVTLDPEISSNSDEKFSINLDSEEKNSGNVSEFSSIDELGDDQILKPVEESNGNDLRKQEVVGIVNKSGKNSDPDYFNDKSNDSVNTSISNIISNSGKGEILSVELPVAPREENLEPMILDVPDSERLAVDESLKEMKDNKAHDENSMSELDEGGILSPISASPIIPQSEREQIESSTTYTSHVLNNQFNIEVPEYSGSIGMTPSNTNLLGEVVAEVSPVRDVIEILSPSLDNFTKKKHSPTIY